MSNPQISQPDVGYTALHKILSEHVSLEGLSIKAKVYPEVGTLWTVAVGGKTVTCWTLEKAGFLLAEAFCAEKVAARRSAEASG